MRVGEVYKNRNKTQKDYIIITEVSDTSCCYAFYTKEGFVVERPDERVSKSAILSWGISTTPKIKY